MADYYSRLNHAQDKKEALQHFLVDLKLSKDKDLFDKEHFERMLSALDMTLTADEQDEFLYWMNDEYKTLKSRLEAEERQRREEERLAIIERNSPKVKPKGFLANCDPMVLYVGVIAGLLILVSFLKSIFS